jgi:glycosyltransferase involved in cell wall biosynthesis
MTAEEAETRSPWSQDDYGLAGRRVSMLVWNEFVYDARVTREASALVAQGACVQVTGILGRKRAVARETTGDGIAVNRVHREQPHLSRLMFLPRYALRRLRERLVGRPIKSVGLGPLRWWQLDRRLIFLLEELGVNWRMYRSACRFRPDVVHAHDVNTLVPAWLAARRCGARLIYDAHEISADREGYVGRVWLVKLVERWLGRRADGTITTTGARAVWFESAYGYRNMVVLQNRPVRCIADGSRRIRNHFQIPDGAVVVLYQGGLQWGRGLQNLVKAMHDVPGAHLVFVGDGEQRHSLEAAAQPLGARVHFAGQVPLDELPEWTASADIGVQTLRNTCLNHYTTDSNKLFEYLMGGLPVVASDFPEIRQIVTEWDVGLLVDPHDVASVRAALRRLTDDPALRRRLAENARRARDHLDWASQAPELIALYRRVLEPR